MIQMHSKPSQITLTIAKIAQMKFQLETFVFISYRLVSTSYTNYAEDLILPLLKLQKSLKTVAVDFYDESYVDEESELFVRSSGIGRNDMTQLENFVRREKCFLQSHKCLQYLRMKDIFLVLKLSLSKELINFIDHFDEKYIWTIRMSNCSGRYDPESVLPLRFANFTIT